MITLSLIIAILVCTTIYGAYILGYQRGRESASCASMGMGAAILAAVIPFFLLSQENQSGFFDSILNLYKKVDEDASKEK